jgi:hypothetical protein
MPSLTTLFPGSPFNIVFFDNLFSNNRPSLGPVLRDKGTDCIIFFLWPYTSIVFNHYEADLRIQVYFPLNFPSFFGGVKEKAFLPIWHFSIKWSIVINVLWRIELFRILSLRIFCWQPFHFSQISGQQKQQHTTLKKLFQCLCSVVLFFSYVSLRDKLFQSKDAIKNGQWLGGLFET